MERRCSVNSEDDFRDMVGCMLRHTLRLAEHVIGLAPRHPGRTSLGMLLQEIGRLEELVDAYGARTNQYWLPFRRGVAAVKLFSDVHYKLLHLKYSISLYALMRVEQDIDPATDRAVKASGRLLTTVLTGFVELARGYGLYSDFAPYEPRCVESEEVTWRLPNDLRRAAVHRKPDETVVSLATAFLNEVEGSDFRSVYAALRDRGFCDCVPAVACEKDFRRFEDVFHNQQALYDSYIGGTDLEQADEKLAFLRGHATIVYHLLEVITGLTHHYERHMIGADDSYRAAFGDMHDDMAWIVVSYAMEFAMLYATSAQDLCRELIRKYTQTGTVVLPAPAYRGFHVRPSTLIARIVRHYGSEVTLELEGERCDASAPLEIIRVNERINAIKRRAIGRALVEMTDPDGHKGDFPGAFQEILMALLRQKKLVIYSQEMNLEDIQVADGETLGEYARRAVAQLLAEGAIDIRADIGVTFHGDKRALDDLKLLADCGYGEDQFGNNIPLPPELGYLRR
ncbi:MAG: HPr family phosphocarrier protein [Spirochaetaceae bacterium]|nr:MAG: HPr family phosphocarrier protein [Spirochaetaceae bacterium]